MSRAGGRSGCGIRAGSTPPAWCSSTRPGPRPTWRRSGAGRRCGQRLKAKVPHGHWKTMTFLAALRHDRVDAPWLIDGPINGESFLLYVEKVLAADPPAGRHRRHGQSRLATRARPCAAPSERPAPSSSSCRNTPRPQSDRDSSSPSSSTGCERPPDGPSMPSATPSARSSTASHLSSAQTTSQTQAMTEGNLIPL